MNNTHNSIPESDVIGGIIGFVAYYFNMFFVDQIPHILSAIICAVLSATAVHFWNKFLKKFWK